MKEEKEEKEIANKKHTTNARSSVVDRLVGDGELTEVVSDHLRLDLNLVECLAVVHSDD